MVKDQTVKATNKAGRHQRTRTELIGTSQITTGIRSRATTPQPDPIKTIERLYTLHHKAQQSLQIKRDDKLREETRPHTRSYSAHSQRTPLYKRVDQVLLNKERLLEHKKRLIAQEREQKLMQSKLQTD